MPSQPSTDGFHPRIANALVSIAPSSKRPAWHGAPTVLGLLRDVSAEHALFRPLPDMNCIREIALHVAYWNFNVGNILTGQSAFLDVPQRTAGWVEPVSELSEGQWARERTLVEISFLFLTDAVRDFDPARLDEPPPGSGAADGRKPAKPLTRPAAQYIHGIAEHNLYHAAQIKALKLLAAGMDGGASRQTKPAAKPAAKPRTAPTRTTKRRA
ncbi:MAG: DinB family protein [Planctomycetaceae bacterium]|jgi:hypothetical protein|nr:DinB family protein [Phycisphaerales bacterium]MCE2654059.1 DinB family protein [Planctomycetaceae bacterium]